MKHQLRHRHSPILKIATFSIHLITLLSFTLISGCKNQKKIDSVTPSNGATDIAQNAIIHISFQSSISKEDIDSYSYSLSEYVPPKVDQTQESSPTDNNTTQPTSEEEEKQNLTIPTTDVSSAPKSIPGTINYETIKGENGLEHVIVHYYPSTLLGHSKTYELIVSKKYSSQTQTNNQIPVLRSTFTIVDDDQKNAVVSQIFIDRHQIQDNTTQIEVEENNFPITIIFDRPIQPERLKNALSVKRIASAITSADTTKEHSESVTIYPFLIESKDEKMRFRKYMFAPRNPFDLTTYNLSASIDRRQIVNPIDFIAKKKSSGGRIPDDYLSESEFLPNKTHDPFSK